jgi:hypothetical protein
LMFDFFCDPLVRQTILVTVQCADPIITFSSAHWKDTFLPKRNTWTSKILPANKNMSFIANSMVTEMRTLGQENVFSYTMNGVILLTLVSHQKPLSIYHKITSQPEFSQVGATESLKYADTRFRTKVIMGRLRGLLSTKSIYRNLFVLSGDGGMGGKTETTNTR